MTRQCREWTGIKGLTKTTTCSRDYERKKWEKFLSSFIDKGVEENIPPTSRTTEIQSTEKHTFNRQYAFRHLTERRTYHVSKSIDSQSEGVESQVCGEVVSCDEGNVLNKGSHSCWFFFGCFIDFSMLLLFMCRSWIGNGKPFWTEKGFRKREEKRKRNEWQIRWDSHSDNSTSISQRFQVIELSFQLTLEWIQRSKCILFLLQETRQRRAIEFSTPLLFVTLNCCHRESISHLAAEDATTSDRRRMAATFILMSSICVSVKSSSPPLYVVNCNFLSVLLDIRRYDSVNHHHYLLC